jgi:hypothetical protein
MPSYEVLTCISDAGTWSQAADSYVVEGQQISHRKTTVLAADMRCEGKKWQTSSVTLPESGKGLRPRACMLEIALCNFC